MKTTILIAAIFFSGLTFAQEKKDSVKTKSIEGVTLTKQVFKKQSDRFVYDVAASPVAKGNTTFDLLKQTPLLSTTDDKTLKIVGKNNAVIFINGRKTNMDAESLTQFLKNTPAENIQKIEVITVPGSEYQVEASDGIINIILKKKMSNGTSGNMRMSNTQNKYNASNASFSVNYRKDKLGINANLSGGENIQPQSYILRNGIGDVKNESVGNIDDPNKNIGGYLNIDYQLTEKSNLALSWNSWANKSYNSTIDLYNTLVQPDPKHAGQLLTSHTWTKNKEDARNYNNSVNLNYEIKLDSLGSKFNVNAAYLNYKRFQFSKNNTLNESLTPIKTITQDIPQIINNFSGTVDYIQKFKNDFTVSVGGNFNKTKTDNDTKNFTYFFKDDGSLDSVNPNPKSDFNHFIYDENIYGVYLTFEKKFSDKFSGKVGARYEITNSLGTADSWKDGVESYQQIDRNYNNLLPYLSFNYAINDKNNLSYSFSSRMRRPSFWELNPVKNIITEDNYTQNNPFVKASSTYNQELTYMYKNSYFLILNHTYEKDQITQVPLQKTYMDKDNMERVRLAYIRTNFGDKQEMSAMVGVQKSLFKQYLTLNFNAGVQHNINNGTLDTDPTTGEVFDTYINNRKSTSFVVTSNNTLRLDKKKTWFLGVNFFYVDKQQIELGMLKNLMSLDLSIKKNWNDWTFAVNVNDVLRTNVVEIEDRQDNGNYNYIKNDMYRRSLSVSITYNFGNQKVKKVRDIESASDAIKNRTR
ncbi:TonB-dependent receptor domain-containing protein [Chryseobacterium sp. MMS23-Vi53]|uniref:TonB-dependent receptor domain-containing protein n=1 Tax=Chryseobacterium sp. MMS23-Vi53 TaxID=3386644 RepID=UPI0039E7428C